MATRAPRAPQVPGESQQPEVDGLDAAETVETPEQELARLRAENQALRESAGRTLPKPEAEATETSEEQTYREHARGLRAKDVDPTRLKRAVLTADGWVCPVAAPAPKGRE